MPTHESFDDSIFEGVKAEHGQPSAWNEERRNRLECSLELTELVVDVQTDGLECTGRGMDSLPAATGPRGARDDCRQSSGRLDRSAAIPLGHDCVRDASRRSLFAQLQQHPFDFPPGCAPEPLARGNSAARIHAHVERTVTEEAESTCRLVKLRRGNTKVHQRRIDATSETDSTGNGVDLAETRVVHREPRVRVSKLPRNRYRLRIAIDGEHASRGSEPIKQCPSVAATPERAIDVESIGAWG